MKNEEFSAQFDVWYNNITSNQAPGLNEYEKSVFLTAAEKQLVKEAFNARVDSVGGGFDGSQQRQYDFSQLIETTELSPLSDVADYTHVDKRSVAYLFPKDYFLSVNEALSDENFQYTVIPLNYAEYSRLMLKPYNFPVKRAVWRLFTGTFTVTPTVTDTNAGTTELKPRGFDEETGEVEGNTETEDSTSTDGGTSTDSTTSTSSESYVATVAEIIGKPTMKDGKGRTSAQLKEASVSYVLRYVKKPKPIILELLDNYGEGLTIDGESDVTECVLPSEVHQEILERAVALAKIAWQGGTTAQAAQQREE